MMSPIRGPPSCQPPEVMSQNRTAWCVCVAQMVGGKGGGGVGCRHGRWQRHILSSSATCRLRRAILTGRFFSPSHLILPLIVYFCPIVPLYLAPSVLSPFSISLISLQPMPFYNFAHSLVLCLCVFVSFKVFFLFLACCLSSISLQLPVCLWWFILVSH